jgi:exopolysaccharide biosynthesis polyprenyl glycosylphosphotransferase
MRVGLGTGAPTAAEPQLERLVSRAWGRRDALTRRLLALADVVGLALALGFAELLTSSRTNEFAFFVVGLSFLPLWVVIFKLYGLYDRDIKRISHSTVDDLPWLFHALLVGGLAFWGYIKLFPTSEITQPANFTFPEGVAFGLAALVTVSAFRSLVRRQLIRALGPEQVLVAGSGAMVDPLIRKLSTHPEYGLEPAGLIAEERNGNSRHTLPVLGGPDNVREVATRLGAERLVICRQDFPEHQVLDMIQVCRALSLKVSLLPATFDALGPSVEIDEVEGVTVLGVNPPVLSRTSRGLKRAFDLLVAAPLVLLGIPFLVCLAIAIKLDSRGPVLFRQERIGQGGRHFQLLKFRTMVIDAERRRAELLERSNDPNWLHLEVDPRITRIGRFLRTTSLDELPQLWNVIRGDMSLVGPRPLIEEEDRLVAGWMRGRLDLMPGITGLWQVLGRTSIPFEEMVKLDYLYVANWSLWFDIRLLIRTLPVVLSRRGAN